MVLKSLVFWTIFFSVIVFSFRYYIAQRKGSLEQLRQRRGWGWFFKLIDWFQRQGKRLRRGIGTVAADGLDRFRAIRMVGQLRRPGPGAYWNRLPARTRVLLTYLEMLRWNEQHSIRRLKGQTPFEYGEILANRYTTSRVEITQITHWFIEARYTRHIISDLDATAMRAAWARLKSQIQNGQV